MRKRLLSVEYFYFGGSDGTQSALQEAAPKFA